MTSLAASLVAARRARTLLDSGTLTPPGSHAEAFAAQVEVMRALGLATGGWKVTILPDGSPVGAPMPAPLRTVAPGLSYAAGADGVPLVEIELALRLKADLPPGRYGRDEIMAAVETVILGYEIIESRYRQPPPTFPLVLADAQGNADYICGEVVPAAALDDWKERRCIVTADGETVYDQPAKHPNGDPLAPVIAFAALQHPAGSFRAGQVITTGSLCGGVRVARGARCTMQLSGFAPVAIAIG